MPFLPIVERELRVAGRQRGTWLVRVGVAATGVAVGCWVLTVQEFRDPASVGMALFVPTAVIVMLFSFLGGARSTADSISEEKREGTLGLLFLTDLRGYDVVIGKLVASSLQLIYSLLAVFPLLAIPLLAGGVSVQEFGRVVLAALNTLFVSLTIGIFCSAICRDERRAIALTVLILLMLTGVFPLIGSVIADFRGRSNIHPFFYLPSPAYAGAMAFRSVAGNSPSSVGFYAALACQHLFGWACLLAACYWVPRMWQDRPASIGQQNFRERLRFIELGSYLDRETRRTRMLAENAFYWLTNRQRLKAYGIAAFVSLLGLIWSLFAWRFWARGGLEFFHILTALTLHSGLKIWIAAEAGRQLCDDRRSGALELLLSTPLTVREIIVGQGLALTRQFGTPILVVTLADIAFCCSQRNEDWHWAWGVGMILFVVDMFCLPVVGMWRGLNNHNSLRAALETVARLLLLPWILWGLLWTAIISIFAKQGNFWRVIAESHLFYVSWVAIGLGVNLLFTTMAWNRLHGRFREVAASRFSRGKQFFGSPTTKLRE